MDVLETALRVGMPVFVVTSLAEAGLTVAPRDVLAPLRDVRFVFLTLIVGWVVCPAVAYVLIEAIPLPAPYATGLVLLALAPGAPFAPAMARIVAADAAYMAAFMVLTAAATVVFMPIGVPLLIDGSAASPALIAGPLLLLVLLPLLVGTMVRGSCRDLADRVRLVLAGITRILAVGLLALIVVLHGRGVIDAVGSLAILTLLIFTGVVTLAAHLLGADLADERRSVLTIGMCTRNLGAALAVAGVIDSDRRVIVMIAIAVPVMLVVAAATARLLADRDPRAADSANPRRNRIAVPDRGVRPSDDTSRAPSAKS